MADVLLLNGAEVQSLLQNRGRQLIACVRQAYLSFASGACVLPPALFVRFPGRARDRIIALPGYMQAPHDIAGIKWISSVPDNVARGLPRAHAVVVLNNAQTGEIEMIAEGSYISACRTAASAALAFELLAEGRVRSVALVGAGPINFETLRMLQVVAPDLSTCSVYDLDARRSDYFAGRARESLRGVDVSAAPSLVAALRDHDVVSFATSAIAPHVTALPEDTKATVILHLSVRDLEPELMARAYNVVDARAHALQAATSLELAADTLGRDRLALVDIAEIIVGAPTVQRKAGQLAIFSPFGLACLDLAVAALVRSAAIDDGVGQLLPDFSASFF